MLPRLYPHHHHDHQLKWCGRSGLVVGLYEPIVGDHCQWIEQPLTTVARYHIERVATRGQFLLEGFVHVANIVQLAYFVENFAI